MSIPKKISPQKLFLSKSSSGRPLYQKIRRQQIIKLLVAMMTKYSWQTTHMEMNLEKQEGKNNKLGIWMNVWGGIKYIYIYIYISN